jgi:hypothetical protein
MPPTEEAGGVRQLRVIAGEGMLVATADGYFVDEFGERQEIQAGITRVAPDHPLARQRPEAFRVAWNQDAIVMRQHRNNLLARMQEVRGEQRAPDKPTTRPGWWIGMSFPRREDRRVGALEESTLALR